MLLGKIEGDSLSSLGVPPLPCVFRFEGVSAGPTDREMKRETGTREASLLQVSGPHPCPDLPRLFRD